MYLDSTLDVCLTTWKHSSVSIMGYLYTTSIFLLVCALYGKVFGL
jgi:hypothetical protein